ncbi:hypothetical protein L6164_001606 [Bauhinia variegata]|uniref:Uncharacterized protein n=1 Tax=Bauhinia variegata TaxID=167791 RepID=A0ACB9QA74_BAUVA|nr:hypothetical protein L6164_001606 [Bauhinia variegata]
MWTQKLQIKVPMILNLILLIVCATAPSISGLNPRKLDETTVPTTPTGDEKCSPCGYSTPPPPSPPPPAIPPPSPPPPSPKKTPSSYCPPPPSGYLYITGPPGNLYPIDENFNGANRHSRSFAAALPALVGFLTLLAYW